MNPFRFFSDIMIPDENQLDNYYEVAQLLIR